jgi:hypothetical protein
MATYPTVEMYLNSAWTDITSYVYYRDMIEIVRGQSGEGSNTDTSSCRMTLDNRDGRWSPRNPSGPYYGQLTRNVPLRVSIDAGEAYLKLTGAASERATTPDAAALDITGDIDIRVELSLDDWYGGSDEAELIGKYNTAAQRSWFIYLTGNGQIAYRWSADGATFTEVQSDAIYLPHHMRRAIRVTHDVNDGAGNNVVSFYTSDSIDGDWELVSEETTAGTTSIFASTATMEIGDLSSLAADVSPGRIYKAEVRNGIDGTVVTNPDFTTQTPGAASFADSTGKTWTIAGTASIANRKTRFVGEVSSLVIDSDKSGRDATVKLEAAGLMRRLGQGESPIDSALRRFIKVNEPIECWPLTDGSQAVVAKSLVGGGDMAQYIESGTDDLAAEFAAGALGPGIEPVILVQPDCTGVFAGRVPNSTSAASKWSVDLFLTGGGNESAGAFVINDRGAGSDADNRIEFFVIFNGNLDSLATTWTAHGETSSSTALLTAGSNAFVYDNDLHHIRLTMDPLATTTDWAMYVDGALLDSGNIGVVVKAVKDIELRWGFLTLANQTMTSRSFGYITYWDGTGPTAAEMWEAAGGFTGEQAGDRLERLTTEEGITYQRIGQSTVTPQMGIQVQDQLMDILRDCETADMGFLYEPREVLGLAYRDLQSIYNQDARLTLDYASNELAEALLPVEDDQTIRNDITAKQTYGSTYRITKDTGTLSTQDPPNGVGRYDESVTVNLYDQDDLPSYANWRLHLGTVDEARYPQISLNLRHATFTSDVSMMEDALRLDLGDRLVITNPPSWVPPDDIELIAVGFTETLGAKEREIVVNCVPASPFNIAVSDSSTSRADTGGCTIIEDLTDTETDVSVLTQDGSYRWVDSATYSSDFPFDVRCGGEVMTVTACTSGAKDDFSTNQTDSWGSADIGGTWTNAGGTVGGDYDVAGGVGTHTLTSVNVSRRSTLTAPHADFDIYCDIATSALATGASLNGAVMARVSDSNNLYMARLEFTTANAIILTIRERAAGVEAALGSSYTTGLTHVAGTYYRVRFQGSGTTLRAKVWPVGTTEDEWQVTTTDSTLTAAGSIGCRSIASTGNTNVNPVVSFDNFELVNPQIFTVTRSVNGVTKTHSSGASISLANPMYVGR